MERVGKTNARVIVLLYLYVLQRAIDDCTIGPAPRLIPRRSLKHVSQAFKVHSFLSPKNDVSEGMLEAHPLAWVHMGLRQMRWSGEFDFWLFAKTLHLKAAS